MAKSSWTKFPHSDKAYAYDGPALKKHWDRLHRGDCEPYPKSEALQEAWRHYHAGEFEQAVATGLDAGEVKIPTADGEIPAYRAMPTAKGPHAVVLEVHFKRLLERKVEVATALCEGLVASGEMKAAKVDIPALATNMVVVATYWLSYDYVRNPRHQQPEATLASGAYQVVALAAPFLAPRARALFDRLASAYVAS